MPTIEILIEEICPYCDEPIGPRYPALFEGLPVTTYRTLPDLMASLWPLTVPDARSTNLRGRRVYGKDSSLKHAVCSQHEYESGLLPLAIQFSWPKDTDEEKLLRRLKERGCWFRLKGVFRKPWTGVVMMGENSGRETSRRFKTLSKRIDKERDQITKAG